MAGAGARVAASAAAAGLFFIVVDSIYAGLATPTEAVALGLVATVELVAINRKLTLPVMLAAFEGTVRTTCMIMLILIEAALISPPVGMNLYVVQAVRKGGDAFSDLFKGVAPFLVAMLGMICLLLAFPQLALWLPTIVNPKAGG